MYYRRKIILALLQLFGGQLDKIQLQKLLFLFTRRQTKPVYDFIPHRFGSFSYSANADMTTMVNKGLLKEAETSFTRTDQTDLLQCITPEDRELLMTIRSEFGGWSAHDLMRFTYIHFPFYAINSVTAPTLLTMDELAAVTNARPKSDEPVLFTIGYEGISLEEYLTRLIIHQVNVLVDVRNNPLSMKYGFSKSQLMKWCGNAGIKYIHFPEVGIRGDQRKELNNQTDYDKLFEIYRQTNLPETRAQQQEILNLLNQHKRIALTCFEADVCQCHRKSLAEAIQSTPGFNSMVRHL